MEDLTKQLGFEIDTDVKPLCEDCPLVGQDKVEGCGTNEDETTEYEVVVVGIGPGFEEIRTGKPFTGKSGSLLKMVLTKLGIEDFYVTNCLLCPGIDDLSDKDKRQALRCCKVRLYSEIKKVNPRLVIALGGVALENLTNEDYKVTESAGRVLPIPEALGYNVIPVVHPAAILRRSDEFPDFLDSLKAAKRWLSGTYIYPGIPETVVITEDNIGEILQRIENAPEVAVDIETTRKGFYPYGREPDGIRAIGLAIDDKTAYIVPGESSEHFSETPNLVNDPRIKELLNKKYTILHNGQFDCGFLWQAGYRLGINYDTMLAHHQIDERPYAHGLKALAHKFLGAPDWEADIKRFLPNKKSSYDLIPTEDLYTYLSHDIVYTYQLKQLFSREVSTETDNVFSNLIMPCANMFIDLRHRGMFIDPPVLFEAEEALSEEMATQLDELREEVGWPINPMSPPEIAELVYDKLEFPEVKNMGRTTSKKIISGFNHPLIEQILEIRELNKLRSTYVASMAQFLDLEYKIHPFMKLFGTVTGRVSAEDPSVLNIVKNKRIKRMYIPQKGWYLMEADNKQMELRCYAAIARDQVLRDKLMSDLPEDDPHRMVAAKVYGEDKADEMRQKAKTGVFGKLYGRGAESFMRGYGVSRTEALNLMSTIDALFPSLKAYNMKVRKDIHGQGFLKSYFGRYRRMGLITDENKNELYRQGANFQVQSMASDVNLYVMLHLYKNRKELNLHPLWPIHDSVVMEIESPEAIPTIKKAMEDSASALVEDWIRFKVDIKFGKNWGDVEKYKEAK